MEKISVNVVGNGSSNDHSTRLYCIGNGFRGVIGKVTCTIADCLYLGFTAERKYVVTVEGDLVISTETSDGFETKTDGVYGFDIDWSQTAKANGTGSGKIVVTNPDAPSEVSSFEVVIAESPTVRVVFPFGAGNYARVNLRDADISVVDPAVQKLLSANDDDNVYSLGVAFYEAMLPQMGDSAFRMLTDIDYVFGDRRFPSFGNRPIEEENPVMHTKLFRIDEQPDFIYGEGRRPFGLNLSDRSTFPNQEHLVVVGNFNRGDAGAEHESFADVLPLILGHEFGHRPSPGDVLVGSRNFSRDGDLDLVLTGSSNLSRDGAAPVASSADLYHRMLGLFDSLADHPAFAKPGVPVFTIIDASEFGAGDLEGLFGHPAGYHRPEDFCAHAGSAECALVDALMSGRPIGVGTPLNAGLSDHPGAVYKLGDVAVVPAGIEDLMASYGNDGDGDAAIEIRRDMRDFDQLTRTRANDLERIERAVAAANALGIDTSNIASKRDAALARLAVFSDRFETGGTHEVTAAEATIINEVFGGLWGIHSDLDTLVSHWHHYKQHEANHDAWEARLAGRKRNFKVAEGAEDNRIAQMYIGYAANPADCLAESKAAFVELFQAIQRGDLGAAHKADTRARQFSTREHMLDALIRRGKLVAVEDNSAVA